jgi:steroid delta-isomerase-like uncharacterized protein
VPSACPLIQARASPQTAVEESVVQEQIAGVLEAFNSHDADRFVALMTEDVVFDHSAWPTTMRGRAEVRSFYADNTWKAVPDLRLELADGPFLHPHAPRYSVAWRAVGTHTGQIDPPGFAPTGKRIEFPVLEISELRDGRASRVRIAIDMADVMRQLGLLAAPGSRAERAMATLQRLQMKVSRRR